VNFLGRAEANVNNLARAESWIIGQTAASILSKASMCLSLAHGEKERAMMTKGEFLNRFQRQSNGTWWCTKPIKIEGPRGPFTIKQGTSFSPGGSLLGLDLAKELDQMAAQQGFKSQQ
jgi:hypothetical protein